ncbi:MAG: cytochrome c oxidase subunit I [Nitriliruptorales bacterium]
MATASVDQRAAVLRRPRAKHGLSGWLTTVDHKKIGILYGGASFVFLLIGGVEALLIRLQLVGPDGNVLSAEMYNQLFTMHGVTMIFLVIMPMTAALMNYVMPIQIGARDMAFPRLNAFSYWVFLAGGIFLYSSFFLGGAPSGGWFGYAPNSTFAFNPDRGMTFYAIGLQVLGVASLATAVNFIVTILNLRAPGMTFLRMPVFTWMTFVTAALLLFAMPVLAVGLFALTFDRVFGANFFDVSAGADPVLWQHLFWVFGHPEVYIMILPSFGIVSEVLPVFSRKPLFGYPAVVFAGAAIAFIGFGVWAHHMFAVGLGPIANTGFALSSMIVAVPTGIKIFNWVATTWGGRLRLTTAMLFALGLIAQFTIGGLSGVTHAIAPHDYQQTDTYYIVAHFHYVLFGGAMFGIFAGFYYWWPKMFGRLLDERLGKLNFWSMFVGFNLTFFPMHLSGLWGQPRRTYIYPAGMGWDLTNLLSTIGAFVIAISVLVFIANVVLTRSRGEAAPGDPWDGRTLEWSVESPTPEYNFHEVPVVNARDEWWHRKYEEDREGRPVRVPAGAAVDQPELASGGRERGIHLPDPSYWPLVVGVGLMILSYGAVYMRPEQAASSRWSVAGIVVFVLGLIVTLSGIYGWALEPLEEHANGDHPTG